MKKGTVKWFDAEKGYGFIIGEDGKDVFVHQTQIKMSGFRSLNEGDSVAYERGKSPNGKEQAVNVQPLLTLRKVEKVLKKEGLYVEPFKDTYGNRIYHVINEDKLIQNCEQGQTLEEIATAYEIESEHAEA